MSALVLIEIAKKIARMAKTPIIKKFNLAAMATINHKVETGNKRLVTSYQSPETRY